MLVKRPNFEELSQLREYLVNCETAAVPPPDESFLPKGGLLSAWGSRSAAVNALLQPCVAKTLGDVLPSNRHAVPDCEQTLALTRQERLHQLIGVLPKFNAFKWLQQQAAVSGALASFAIIQKRRKADDSFTDDLATLRFWRLSVCAAMFMDSRFPNPPSADDRGKAIAAAKQLHAIARRTTLLRDAGIEFPESERVLQRLQTIAKLSVEKRKRVDAHTDDRRYVQLLAAEADRLFGDIPPALIYGLAALKVKNPDKAAITRQIGDYKKDRHATV